MENQKSDINANNPPIEQLIIEKWKEFWDPPYDVALRRLIDRIKYQTEFKNREHKHEEDPVEISLDIIKNEISFPNFPKYIPSWVEIGERGNQILHPKKKIDHHSEFKKIISESEIGSLFRQYFKNINKSRATSYLFYFSLILLVSNLVFLLSSFTFKWSPFAVFFESNILILLYLSIPTIYAVITMFYFMYKLETKVKPSKWHWLDIIVIILFPSIYYLLELNTNLRFLNIFVFDIVPINLREFILTYSLLNSFIILMLAITSISNSIIPCTPRGQFLYSLLKLEYLLKSEKASELKKIPKFFHSTIISLNDLIFKFFNLSIKNLTEVESAFNTKLLKTGRGFFIDNFTISNDDVLLKHFNHGINGNIKEKIKVQLSKKEEKKVMRDTEYQNNLNLISKVIDKFEFNVKELIFVRITLKIRLKYKFQKIFSIILAGFSFFLINILPLYLQ